MRVEPPPGSDLVKTANVYAHTRSLGFGKEVQRRMLLGTYALSAECVSFLVIIASPTADPCTYSAFENYFLQAQRVRKLIKTDFDRVFCVPNALAPAYSAPAQGVHVLLHPSAIQTAPMLPGAGDAIPDAEEPSSLDAYVQDVMTVPASLAGLPAMSVPGGKGADGWPIGVSVVSQWGCDDLVMRVGEIIEGCQEDD